MVLLMHFVNHTLNFFLNSSQFIIYAILVVCSILHFCVLLLIIALFISFLEIANLWNDTFFWHMHLDFA